MSIDSLAQQQDSEPASDLLGISKMILILSIDASADSFENAQPQEAELLQLDRPDIESQPTNRLPLEILYEIIQAAWLDVPLFDALGRWSLFSRLSLVNRTFRELTLRTSIRNVRVLGHCSMDISAYRSIGQQYLALNPSPGSSSTNNAQDDQALSLLFQHSTVHLDFTYATYWVCRDRDRWLKDDIAPGRPDDSVRACVVPGPPSFYAEMTGRTGGPAPLFPALEGVREVRLSRFPFCTCKPMYMGNGHQAECIISRMLLPFPALETLRVDARPDHPEDVFIPPIEGRRVQVSLGTQAVDRAVWYMEGTEPIEVDDADMGPFLGRTPPPLWVPWLKIPTSDALWETVDPVRIWYPGPHSLRG
ncbi:hypothetical protein BN946_scf184938.g58 [Trametes cinnabarina]|uniref:F-box domain-containing protein n=1 Tax=Pycnoporus cinnabarinus TaxID=5643 RepID=A0A060S204_PYCCI|nr:hypothetical protein BN946_scf184938.g58 [Trametes cinnabarina]